MRTAIPLTVLATAFACSLAPAPANARARVFVASYGNDANPCTFGSPCKTFQHAHDVVDAGGDVTAIDSAGFGPINITKSVSITSPAGVEAGIVSTSGGNGITINAGPNDAVYLQGLFIDGGGGVGSNGIVLNSGRRLTVANCVAKNFFSNNSIAGITGAGILIQPTSGTLDFSISDSIVSNNDDTGIRFWSPTGSGTIIAHGVINHVIATENFTGMGFLPAGATGGSLVIAVTKSVASNNSGFGIFGNGVAAFPNFTLSIDDTTVTGNQEGLAMFAPIKVFLGRSVIVGNGVPFQNSAPGNWFSYKNNQFDESIGTALNTSIGLQ